MGIPFIMENFFRHFLHLILSFFTKSSFLQEGHTHKFFINSWLSIPNSFTAEAFGKMGWDSITIDMQHGQNDYQSSISMLQALSNAIQYQW